MNGCIYRTEENKCKQFSVGGVLSFCYLDGTCDCQIPSNADHIRSMTDGELAGIMVDDCPPNYPNGTYEEHCRGYEEYDGNLDCCKCWLDWLKAPVEGMQDD